MKKRLILSAALMMAAAGCKLLEPQPTPLPGAQCSTLGPAPSLPPAQPIVDTSAMPSVPSSQFIIVSTCEATGTYVATGVDTQAGRFTFLFKGGSSTRSAAFAKLYAAGVPVTVYTGSVTLKAGEVTPFDPCARTGDAPKEPTSPGIGDDPRDPPVPPGIGDDPRDPPVPPGIAALAWCTANALTAVTN